MHACMYACIGELEGSWGFYVLPHTMGENGSCRPRSCYCTRQEAPTVWKIKCHLFHCLLFFSLCCSGRPVSKQPSRGQWITAVSTLFHKITNQRKRARKRLGQHATSSAHTATSAHAALLPIPLPSVPPSASWGLGRGECEMHGVWNLYLKILTLSLESERWFLKEITYLGWWWR